MVSWRLIALLALMLLATMVHAQDDLEPEAVPGDTAISEEAPPPLPDSVPEAAPQTTPVSINGRSRPLEQERDLGRVIELRSAIEESLRRNPFEQVRTNTNASIDLLKQDLVESFWMPNLSLELNAANQRYDRFYSSQSQTTGLGSQVAPGGNFGLTIKDYTVFNWGRDYLNYLNSKQILNRETQRLTEARRKLRFGTIAQFFSLVRAKEIVKIKREQLRQASFIHRLAREKLQLRKIPAMEYYQTRSEFLRAQTEYQQSLYDVGQEEERMANYLGDDYHPSYRTVEQLKFTSLTSTAEEALRQSVETAPSLRDAKVAYETAQRSYEKTLKDNLPLPKFTVGVGTYQQQFGPNGNTWNRSTPTGRNVEMVAAVNMTWTLIGEGGLFNSRVNKRAYLDKRIAEIQYFNSKRAIDVKIRTLIRTVRYLEQKVTIAEYQDKNARSNFDTTLDNYTAGRTSFPQIKLSLDNWVISKINSENVKLDHLVKKLELAETVGIDDLPGDNFETLAVR
ncbi:MAG: TolC family protein [Bacteriovoracaceae bacterium]|nr:TolC family protein [Bacteriovoracaceae bacterium]